MPEITIKITIPEGVAINLGGLETLIASATSTQTEPPDYVGRYWSQYLSANGRTVFGQAALRERHSGPGYTLEDLAADLSIDYESIKSYHRSTGRSAKRWRRDTGLEEPIRLIPLDYDWDREHQGFRTEYRLPEGVADEVAELRIAS